MRSIVVVRALAAGRVGALKNYIIIEKSPPEARTAEKRSGFKGLSRFNIYIGRIARGLLETSVNSGTRARRQTVSGSCRL